MEKQTDDFEAVRIVVQTLEPFDSKDRERIIRWAKEKLGMPIDAQPGIAAPVPFHAPAEAKGTTQVHATIQRARQGKDIKTFVSEKAPSSDRQLAATVAYYYAFEAPENERKDSIDKDDLIEACRKVGSRRRPTVPGQTLRNAAHAGYLDRTERGKYRLNTVGENLVAMVLPEGGTAAAGQATKKPAKRKATPKKKKGARKKKPQKK